MDKSSVKIVDRIMDSFDQNKDAADKMVRGLVVALQIAAASFGFGVGFGIIFFVFK